MSSLNESKARALIAYIASRSDIGKTKLMKLLYLMDFMMYERSRNTITEDEYRHWSFGPVPVSIWKKLTDGEFADFLDVEKVDRGQAYLKYTAKNPNVNMDDFSPEEMAVINEVLAQHGDKFQDALVKMVHAELPYRITEENEVIPPFLAMYRNYDAKVRAKHAKAINGNAELMKIVKEQLKKSLPDIQRIGRAA